MSARIYPHPTLLHNQQSIVLLESRTGLRAIWTGRHAELQEACASSRWYAAHELALDYTDERQPGKT